MSLRVRRVGPEAAEAVHAVVRAAFAGRPPLDPPADALAETAESLGAALAVAGGLLAELDGRPVAASLLDPVGGVLYLRRFGVVPDARGVGAAAMLVDRALLGAGDCHSVAVLAREELPTAFGFWRAQGFTETSRHWPYVTLERRLPPTYDVPDAAAMRALGRRVGRLLVAGDLVVLTGDLGAGKTTFTQGLAAGLGVRGAVTSPTFVIARVHRSVTDGPDLVHADAYRLGGVAELDDLDLDASVAESVTVVEWGEGLAEVLAGSRLEVHLRRAAGGEHAGADGRDGDEGQADPRTVALVPVGARWQLVPGGR